MRGRRARKLRRGFTLLEALVAGAILAVGLVGLIGLQATLFQSAHISADVSNASYILQHRVEELGSLSQEALAGPPAICPGAAPGCAAGGGWAPAPASGCSQTVREPTALASPSVASAPYRIDTGIVPHPDLLGHPNARVATISVCFAEGTGRVRQLQTTRVLGDR